MRHKYKKHHKAEKKKISEKDQKILYLLNIQLQAIMIYLTADVFFYNFSLILLESAYGNKSDHKPNENVFLVNGCVLALIASILISHVSFTAYENIHFRDLNGEIDYSTNPEESIAISSLYLILLFFINLIGAIELYKRVNICTIKITPQWIVVLKIQLQAYKIRFLGDFSFLIATLESFELINSKYDNSKSNVQNPDIPALIGACLYLVERILLLYVSYQVYSHLVNECGDVIDSKYVEPNKLAILANIIGIIANSISLQAFIEIYKRNVDRPIFGR